MEQLLNETLESGEKILWTGGSCSKRIFDETCRIPIIIRFLLSYGIVAALMIYAVNRTGEFKLSAFLVLLVIGSMIPLNAIAEGVNSGKLFYAATDRRLIRINGSQPMSAYYKNIGACTFREDSSGNTSLLCGQKTVFAKPSRWRSIALFTGTLEMDDDEHITNYVLYAIDDPEGLKAALKDKVYLMQ